MKRVITGLVAGLLLATSATALAGSSFYRSGHVACSPFHSGTQRGMVCMLDSGDGYGVGISNQLVMVSNPSGHVVFRRFQP